MNEAPLLITMFNRQGVIEQDEPCGPFVAVADVQRLVEYWRGEVQKERAKAAVVALQEVGLTRDTHGMCIVTVNGREAIRDNGDVISHFATLEWFAASRGGTGNLDEATA